MTTITDRQSEVLSLLDREGPMKVADIAEAIDVRRESTRSMLLSLNGKGQVRRYRDGSSVRWGRPQ